MENKINIEFLKLKGVIQIEMNFFNNNTINNFVLYFLTHS